MTKRTRPKGARRASRRQVFMTVAPIAVELLRQYRMSRKRRPGYSGGSKRGKALDAALDQLSRFFGSGGSRRR